MFEKMAHKALGIPKTNTYTMLNASATQARIKTNLKKMLRRVKAGDSIYFYYNGHGVPVPSEKNTPYLLASNTEPDFVQDEKFFALQNIYSKLSDSKAGKAYQYSNAYNKKGHRLFSYFVMKNILEGESEIKELYKDTKADTYQTSLEEYGDLRVQEPTIDGNARMRL